MFDISTVVSLIGSLGFPIVCCVGLFWYITKQSEQHKTEMEKMSKAIENNTAVMKEFIEKHEKKGE